MLKKLKIFTLFSSVLFSFACQAESLTVGITTGSAAQNTFFPLYSEFEVFLNTGIKISRFPMADMKNLDQDDNWFDNSGKPIDILLGHASQRIEKYFIEGKILPINTYWEKYNLQDDFKHLVDSITFNKHILGLPYQMNGTHIFYKKNLLKNYGNMPKTLPDLASLCRALYKDNIIPFHIAATSQWTSMAWFEYITLRTYGIKFLKEITDGKVSFKSHEVTTILKHWKSLYDANCYHETFGKMHWIDSLPLFYRQKIAMIFVGSYLLPNTMDKNTYNDLDMFNFPKIADIPRYESVPVDIFFVNKKSKNLHNIGKFLSFVAQATIQASIASSLKSIPANNKSMMPNDPLAKKIYREVITAQGTSPFIDRALLPLFELNSREHFVQFMRDGNIDSFQTNMETLRIKHYPLSTTMQTNP